MLHYVLMKRGLKKIYTLDEISKLTCKALALDKKQLTGRSRKQELVDARKIYCHISKKCLKVSLKSIGVEIDRHHSNVIHLIKECKNLKETNNDFRKKYFMVRSHISM